MRYALLRQQEVVRRREVSELRFAQADSGADLLELLIHREGRDHVVAGVSEMRWTEIDPVRVLRRQEPEEKYLRRMPRARNATMSFL